MSEAILEPTIREGVLQARRPETKWLSTGFDGGRTRANAAYNVSVPDGWGETDLRQYVDRRCSIAGFEAPGPALLTGVDLVHARRGRLDGVEVIVTAGVSNPATLPVSVATDGKPAASDHQSETDRSSEYRPGTINIILATTASLPPGALVNLVSVVTEAKTATLLALTGFTGTTSDAIVVGCDPAGPACEFSGSATAVGSAARACVRDALCASLRSRYADEPIPESVEAAEYGVETTAHAAVDSIDR